MRFFRRCRAVIYVVLVALAAQMALASGHTHATGTYQFVRDVACRSFLPPSAGEPCAPRHQDRDDCAICFTMGVASSVVLHDVPSLVLPVFPRESLRPSLDAAPSLVHAAAAFQARGPPSA